MGKPRPVRPMLRIYTTATCGYCKHAKRFMESKEIPFEEVRVDEDQKAAHEMVHLSGQNGVPVITDGEQVVIGFDPDGILHLAGVPHSH